ncbi:MAG TPA: MOSC domain-containing protein [Polyangiaceae bacterium]|nr:MOSC domain-containing protein [Polyangiaceae bacterium]
MITLKEIWVYPVKSLPGTRVSRARVGPRGFSNDRRFMVVSPSGVFITQRKYPRMALLSVELGTDLLRLGSPDGAVIEVPSTPVGPEMQVRVWEDTVTAVDAGDAVAEWLAHVLETPARLVYMPESTVRLADQDNARPDDRVAFQDGFAFLLTSQESLDALNSRLKTPVDMRRFRPNLVVAGGTPFGEDEWTSFELGPVSFCVQKPCARCVIVDVEPDEGVNDGAVLSELARFRNREHRTLFGQNLVHDGCGWLTEGMRLEGCPTLPVTPG